ncbi:MAG: hypothetical protein VX265_13580 [Myxococcota bacterium]|nr:hypothetical protein [Myxococcota bacterium]
MHGSLPRMVLLASLALGAGCVHRVRVSSQPPGAEVRYRGKVVGITPCEFSTVWAPFRRMNVQLRLPGRRTATLRLNRDTGPFRLLGEVLTPWRWGRWVGVQARARHEVVLVRRHGRAGTWTPAEALDGI